MKKNVFQGLVTNYYGKVIYIVVFMHNHFLIWLVHCMHLLKLKLTLSYKNMHAIPWLLQRCGTSYSKYLSSGILGAKKCHFVVGTEGKKDIRLALDQAYSKAYSDGMMTPILICGEFFRNFKNRIECKFLFAFMKCYWGFEINTD